MSLRGNHAISQQGVVPAFGLDQHVRRGFDIAAATIGLMLFAPLLLITSIAIKLVSSGSIFSRETLCDENNNRSVEALKFRVVTTHTEGNRIAQRAAHVGQMLTQSGIDELPQLINVLRSEMSIFGRRNVYRWPEPISCCSSGVTDQKRKRKND